MAFPTAVNSQITDASGDAPAVAMGTLYQTLAHSTGLAYQNAVNAQQQLNTAAQAATVQGVSLLYSVDTAAAATATTNLSYGFTAEAVEKVANVLEKKEGA